MMKLLIFVLFLGCASNDITDYKKSSSDDPFGLSLIKNNDGTMSSVFRANNNTDKTIAKNFSLLGAIESCKNQNKRTLILGENDQTKSKTIIYNQFYAFPPIQTWSRNGNVFTNFPIAPYRQFSYSYPVRYEFPIFITRFKCSDKVFAFPFTFEAENISRELVHPYTKDFKGGVFMKKIGGNQNFLREGDVVISFNNFRVGQSSDLKNKVLPNPDITKSGIVRTRVIRKNKLEDITLSLKNITNEAKEYEDSFITQTCTAIQKKPTICQSQID